MLPNSLALYPQKQASSQSDIVVARTSVPATTATIIANVPVPVGCVVIADYRIIAGDGTDSAVYTGRVVARNVAGTTALVGTESQVAFETDATWGLAATADNTADTIKWTFTPDGTNATVVTGTISSVTTAIVV